MRNTTQRPLGRTSAAAIVASTLSLSALAISPASANPGDGGPGGTVGTGSITISSETAVAKGTKISFVGKDFAKGVNPAVFQALSLKFDVTGPNNGYSGTGNNESALPTFQVQGDGSVSGSVVVPADIDDPSVNPSASGPHFLRVLGGTPALSRWSDDFTVSATAAAAPVVTTTAAVSSGRGGSNVTVTVNATGFKPNEVVTVKRGSAEGTKAIGADGAEVTLTADASGAFVAKTFTSPLGGELRAGDWQLQFLRADTTDPVGISQVTVPALVSLTNPAVASKGTVTISNAQPGATFSTVSFDPDADPANGNDVTVATAEITADTTGVATGVITIPDAALNLGTKTFTATQTYPYAATYTASAKISPDSNVYGADKFTITKSADGAILDGLYQSAYNSVTDALYATTAYQTGGAWDGTLYKLNPNTLAVVDSQRAPLVDPANAAGARFAPYGVAVDSQHNTVWVTNTRQNTVTVYDGTTLDVIKTHPAGTISHSRDVIYDPRTEQVFVTSASEGSSGSGYISVFEADDKNDNGVKYEEITKIQTGLRTEFSPMSLSLDAAAGKLYSPSLTSDKVAVVDTATNTFTLLAVEGLIAQGRGASGIAVDPSTGRLFIASQNTDELVIADATTGALLHEIASGAGALNVAFDSVTKFAYVANFGGQTISVVNADGHKIANLPIARANHVSVDGKGNAFAVDKNGGNRIWKISLTKETPAVPSISSATPVISGTAAYGKTLTAKAGSWTAGATLAYQWKRNGVAIPGATKATYAVVATDAGKTLTVAVTGSKAGFTSAVKISAGVKVASTPAVLRLAKAEAKVAAATAKVSTIKAQIKAAKKSSLTKKAKAKKVKALNKKLNSAKKALTKQKKVLAKAKKAVKKK